MSWDCPDWNHNICDLNGIECKPGKGKCVLRNRYEVVSSKIKTNDPHNQDAGSDTSNSTNKANN